ncbi:MAG: SAM-dependent methyltransferase [Archangium gephyra]|uniref:SAM-dependent methyltransferase n=1 Tax=Archangium gephyra TaxID=48 RepID=A0A2W5UUL0_9BACT|nr:MAG: SAM-dependent methyltransferase [Archangium gephyra]
MTPRRGEYGFDAPYVPALMLAGSLPLWFGAVHPADLLGTLLMGLSAAFLVFCAGTFIFTTRRGKFVVWNELLNLRGDERVLDVGCGRGAVLLLAAQRLTTGRATGIDLWQAQDQSGNALEATQRNAKAEGVNVELHTGDMRALPFADASFDLVVSSLAVHNVPDDEGRAKAVDEMLRVLAPGGRLLLADFKFTKDYAQTLRERGAVDVQERGLGVRFWYGGPWAATTLVSAKK